VRHGNSDATSACDRRLQQSGCAGSGRQRYRSRYGSPAGGGGGFIYPRGPKSSPTVAGSAAAQHGRRGRQRRSRTARGYATRKAQAQATARSVRARALRGFCCWASIWGWFRGSRFDVRIRDAARPVRVVTAAVSSSARCRGGEGRMRRRARAALRCNPLPSSTLHLRRIVPVVAGDASPAEIAEVIEELWDGAEM